MNIPFEIEYYTHREDNKHYVTGIELKEMVSEHWLDTYIENARRINSVYESAEEKCRVFDINQSTWGVKIKLGDELMILWDDHMNINYRTLEQSYKDYLKEVIEFIKELKRN